MNSSSENRKAQSSSVSNLPLAVSQSRSARFCRYGTDPQTVTTLPSCTFQASTDSHWTPHWTSRSTLAAATHSLNESEAFSAACPLSPDPSSLSPPRKDR